MIERGVQEIENEVRALYLNLQDRIGSKIDARERIVAFIPEYAVYLMNRMMVGPDGKTSYERIKGKKPTILGVEFGEKVLYMPLRTGGGRQQDLEPRFRFGLFLGVIAGTQESVIGTPAGAVKARSIRRLVDKDKWDSLLLDTLVCTPWSPKGLGDQDQEVLAHIRELPRC